MEDPSSPKLQHQVQIWTQVVTLISVIGGLGLVYYELRQANTIARIDRVASHYDVEIAANVAKLGEVNLAAIWVKGCSDPASLAPEEVYAFRTVSELPLSFAHRLWRLASIAGQEDAEWKPDAKWYLQEWLGPEIIRREYRGSGLPPALAEIADDVISEQSWIPCEGTTNQFAGAPNSLEY